MLNCWVSVLIAQAGKGQPLANKEIELECRMGTYHLNDGSVPWQPLWHDILWFRAQAAHAVATMKEDLARRLAREETDVGAIVVSEIDADDSPASVQVERLNAIMVHCYCTLSELSVAQEGNTDQTEEHCSSEGTKWKLWLFLKNNYISQRSIWPASIFVVPDAMANDAPQENYK